MRRNILLFISLCVVGCAMMYAQQMPGLLQKGKAGHCRIVRRGG